MSKNKDTIHTHTHNLILPIKTARNNSPFFCVCVCVCVCVVLKIIHQNVSNGYLREDGQVGGEEMGTENSDQGRF